MIIERILVKLLYYIFETKTKQMWELMERIKHVLPQLCLVVEKTRNYKHSYAHVLCDLSFFLRIVFLSINMLFWSIFFWWTMIMNDYVVFLTKGETNFKIFLSSSISTYTVFYDQTSLSYVILIKNGIRANFINLSTLRFSMRLYLA